MGQNHNKIYHLGSASAAVIIAVSALSTQSLKAALASPVNALRYE